MPYSQAVTVGNRLLATLPRKDREQLLANCEHIELTFAKVLYRAGEHVPHVYFPTGSCISLVTPIDDAAGLEVGLVGNEGMLGIALILGVDGRPFTRWFKAQGSPCASRRHHFFIYSNRVPHCSGRCNATFMCH